MANPSTAHEPSMEEILASIRQIISEDSQGTMAPVENVRAEASAPADQVDVEAFEAAMSRFEAVNEGTAAAERDLPARSAEPRPAPAAHQPPARSALETAIAGQLLSPEKGAAVSGAFGSLAHTILANSSRTLEDVVTEMLQPMLKTWLDDNLPSLVERMVKEEIERVSRGRR